MDKYLVTLTVTISDEIYANSHEEAVEKMQKFSDQHPQGDAFKILEEYMNVEEYDWSAEQ